jgi:hypothetical protein
MEKKRIIIDGIEATGRILQPFNVWDKGKIIFFARNQKEAQQALARG